MSGAVIVGHLKVSGEYRGTIQANGRNAVLEEPWDNIPDAIKDAKSWLSDAISDSYHPSATAAALRARDDAQRDAQRQLEAKRSAEQERDRMAAECARLRNELANERKRTAEANRLTHRVIDIIERKISAMEEC